MSVMRASSARELSLELDRMLITPLGHLIALNDFIFMLELICTNTTASLYVKAVVALLIPESSRFCHYSDYSEEF